ncbi:hypothetical protein LEP1GSC173_3148 [Leptospira interrogans str. HAI1594]|uniref:Uncharacterized protein n=1 Tax=Leptospira interrogans serovar Lora str. TE 1992 TaxID=1193028 RepID=M3DKF8_LEPIR|nr:hypothetical protein LEP1GSC077_4232 [Leptospira interrogans str. C10069]EKP76719.1 hypothetical protein LEP1GSC173_3148 [Leptospira interrogans str. HAI1594]EMF41693.1 hypothetical protein LEP1GSC067_4605 [Leptospira interrogans serovar Lora str. TE 1992]EMJ73870.1 hypothetical protein LEP1GSC033_4002 [Leptospira interrogans str. 2002000632]EMN62983.1 hypothetical protein LEP1GSC092_3024 [Leptospira interrogans serovar Pyrogenes str. R168]EMO37894.1 hypothetical protein LEP1GSC177_1746 [Le
MICSKFHIILQKNLNFAVDPTFSKQKQTVDFWKMWEHSQITPNLELLTY